MKIKGIRIQSNNESVLPIQTPEGTLYLIFRPVASYADFDQVCPPPKAPVGGAPGNEHPLTDNKRYQELLSAHSEKFTDWIVLNSLKEVGLEKEVEVENPDYIDTETTPLLSPTKIKNTIEREPIEWEKVDLKDPETFANWRDELRELNGFVEAQLTRILSETMRVNSLSDAVIQEARDNFLAMSRSE